MRIFSAILRNDLRRLLEHKSRLLLFFILTACAVAAAVFLNTQADIVGHIAVVSKQEITLPSNNLNITRLDYSPPISELAIWF